MIPYGRQSIDPVDVDAVVAALTSDWLTTGPEVDRFERALAEHVGSGSRAVSVTSGTAALHVAYAAAGVGRGDRVVTTPLTFVATAATAALLGAEVVFADVDPDTGNLDPAAAAAATGLGTRVVTAVDYAGVPVDGAAFARIAHDAGALFVEDAAHSVGSRYDGTPVGAQADLTTFSFFPTKNMTTAEGGAVLSTDPELDARARRFKNHGLVRDRAAFRHDEGPWHQEVVSFGLNYRLPDVLAALGTAQLARLAEFGRRRAEVHARYSAALRDLDGVTLPAAPDAAEPVWHLYPLRVDPARRRAVFDGLRARGIGVQVNYLPAYWHPVFEDLGYRRGMCPVAEDYYRREISLPMFAGISDDDVDRTIEAVVELVR